MKLGQGLGDFYKLFICRDGWNDDVFSGSAVAPPSLYDSVKNGGGTTALVESIHAQLKIKEGEPQHGTMQGYIFFKILLSRGWIAVGKF